MASIDIRIVEDNKSFKQFLHFPWQIYTHDPLWVPPLLFDLKRQLNTQKNPFFHHARIRFLLALIDNRCVGRIAAIIDDNHNLHHGEKTGFFGYFECINNQDVADALFHAASGWLTAEGMESIRGPINLTLDNEAGLLVEGFDRPPMVQMAYNPPYYLQLVENAGFRKAHDLLAYYLGDEVLAKPDILNRLKRISDAVMQREHVTFRPINLKDFKNDLENVRLMFNAYMSKNWGYVPMTREEIDFLASSLKPVLVRDLAVFAEINGKPVGFSLGLPDINQVLKKLNGSLFPFGLFRFLYWKNKISEIRVILMGIDEPYRKRGLEAVFIYHTIIKGTSMGFRGAELSWLSEDNLTLIRELEFLQAKLIKRYRVYQKNLA